MPHGDVVAANAALGGESRARVAVGHHTRHASAVGFGGGPGGGTRPSLQ
jgi:hypothetical protein